MNKSVEQRAGGVVFRKKDGIVEYLLVTSNSNKSRWIFPAGHVEEGETPEIAAVREVIEEAGIEAKIIAALGSFQYFWYRENKKILINTSLFLMEFLKTVQINPEGRQVKFFKYDQISLLNTWEESRTFLEKAYHLIGTITEQM